MQLRARIMVFLFMSTCHWLFQKNVLFTNVNLMKQQFLHKTINVNSASLLIKCVELALIVQRKKMPKYMQNTSKRILFLVLFIDSLSVFEKQVFFCRIMNKDARNYNVVIPT